MSVDGVVLCADATAEGGQLAEALRARGYRVVEATPGGVVAAAAGRLVLLLVLDVDDAQALGALSGFRALPANAAVPVVLVGGPDAPVHDLTGAVEAGGDAFLARPLPIERAVRKVETYVGRPAARPASRPADVWDVPPDSVPAIPKAPRVPESVRASVAASAHVRERTAVTPRRSEPAKSHAEGSTKPGAPDVPRSTGELATSEHDDAPPDADAPLPDAAPPSSEPPPPAAVHVSRTFVLPQQRSGSGASSPPAAPAESTEAPPLVRERTLVLDSPARRAAPGQPRTESATPSAPHTGRAQPPPAPAAPSASASAPAPSRDAPPPPPSLALAFDAQEPASPPDPARRVLLSGDLQNAIDAADRRLFGKAAPLSPLFAPSDEDIDALVSPDMIDGLRQPLEVEERYEAHDAWTVLGEARVVSGAGRSSRELTTGDHAPPTGPSPASEPGTPSTGAKGRSDPAVVLRESTRPGSSTLPPVVTPTDMSLRSDEHSLKIRPRTGMLDARGLLPVLASCIRRRVDGRLTLRGVDGAVSLYLSGGRVVAARTDRRSRSLAWLLVRERRIDTTTARDLDREAESSGRGLGTVLLARGLVPGEDLDSLERRYQEELVVEAIGDSARAGVFELVEGEVALPQGPTLERSTVALTLAALRRRVDPADALARLGGAGARLRVIVPIARLIEDARLSSSEERAIRSLSQHTIGEVVQEHGSDVLAAVHVLEQLGLLELESNTARAPAEPPPASEPRRRERPAADEPSVSPAETPSPSTPVPEPGRLPPRPKLSRRRSPRPPVDPVEPARTLVERAAALAADSDYFAVLGLARDASMLDIRRAYVARRRELGSLDLVALGLSSLLDARALALEVLDEAFAVLRNDELRERYRSHL
ncbi:MAG: hypothetical protein IT379_38330 [Deltaproteobacteria bacterium]|nr:hypothetical protein [Deltaproteobacteria bacterium]